MGFIYFQRHIQTSGFAQRVDTIARTEAIRIFSMSQYVEEETGRHDTK